jgi:nucleoside-diphosphate-sugar epimerase
MFYLGSPFDIPPAGPYPESMRVLVTGASGFVGSTLCEELLRRGVETSALMRKTSTTDNLGAAAVIPVQGDLRNPESLEKAVSEVDLIFHVAGVVAARSREHFFASNAEGTRNLLAAAKKSGRKLSRFVYVSSLAAAGPSLPGRPHEEDDPNQPVSDYGLSKLAGEGAVAEFRADFPVCVVRPPAVYGPRDKGVFTFFQAIRRGVLPLLGMSRPDPRRYSFVHVDDLVQGIVKAGFSPEVRSGEIFYVSGDGEFSWEEAMRLIARGLEQQAVPLRLPIPLMKCAAAACSAYTKASGKVLPFSLDKIKEIEAPAWTCSNAKAKRILGFEPYWTLDRGLAQTAKWYRENGWL